MGNCDTCRFTEAQMADFPCVDCLEYDRYEKPKPPQSGLVDSGERVINAGALKYCYVILDERVEYPTETIRKAAVHARICQSMNDTYKRKNADYGDSFSKMRRELPSAILVRIYDKYSRLKNLMGGAHQHVSDESVKDTLMDLANYCVMELVEMEEVPHG